MTIQAIILNYKTKDDTLQCVDSLKKCKLNSNLKLKIIVVDNASADGIERALTQEHPDVTFIQTGNNLGYTGGNNAGLSYLFQQPVEEADQQFVLILNNDTYFDPNFLTELAQAVVRHPEAAIYSPKVYFDPQSLPNPILDKNNQPYQATESEKNKVIWYAGGEFDWQNVLGNHRGVDQVDVGQFDTEQTIDYASGCCILVPLELIRKLNGLDNRYFMYYEDVDLSERIKRTSGKQVWYIPTAIMWHKNAASSGVGSSLQDYFTTRNRLLLGLKFASLRTKFALLREAWSFKSNETKWLAVKDFCTLKFGKGSFLK